MVRKQKERLGCVVSVCIVISRPILIVAKFQLSVVDIS